MTQYMRNKITQIVDTFALYILNFATITGVQAWVLVFTGDLWILQQITPHLIIASSALLFTCVEYNSLKKYYELPCECPYFKRPA